ncbi:uroporphyrinogen-III synthase [Acinetobacter zhairhuonensis]|uniref:uroporphyrinogen-III synthase n=1 Tax=Acinetobacter sp. A7.4 TaxID=2919921 RepID=UPI001F4FF236|nr:uroporphyrinogen-III synthase [Acinetobacter sp. A7.4]MCJ8162548.1 uroporphyrinogen-III synthase [Acinetobacter sp. A7.4]
MLFINTRPKARATELSFALQQAGIQVLELPLLELEPCAWSTALQSLYLQLPQASCIVVVSPSAVEFGMAGLQQSGLTLQDLQALQWIAVGEKTAQALAAYGIQSHVPEVETSEGMLQIPLLQNLSSSSCIAFWRGQGGRQFMMENLQQQGVSILNFILYQRRCPTQTMKNFEQVVAQLQQHQSYSVLISSEASWLNWLALMQTHPALFAHGHFMVLGERLFQLLFKAQAQQHLAFHLHLLSDLSTETILQCLRAMPRNA